MNVYGILVYDTDQVNGSNGWTTRHIDTVNHKSTCIGLVLNPGFCDEMKTSNRLSHYSGPGELLEYCSANFFVIKPSRCTNFKNLFCHETLQVSESSSVHHQEFIRTGHSCSCSKVVYRPVWHIPLQNVRCIISWWWTDKLSETCRVSWK